MRCSVGLLCVLAALLPEAHALLCTVCNADEQTSCEGQSIRCVAGGVCSSLFKEVTRLDGKKCYQIFRYCGDPKVCGINTYFSFVIYRGRQTITCCDTDNCTPPQPTWPDSQKNGLTCPTCEYNGFDCISNENIECVGEEIKCIKQSTIFIGPLSHDVITYRGCSSESVCIYGNSTYSTYHGSSTESIVTCTDANPGLSSGCSGLQSVLLLANCLMLVKLVLDPSE
ncbi:phospholipase A2 inhibitor and Ly6/PLAUR domain-containing protein-like [Xenopus laevis]|uniref:Phospholipase A2 inhibitor and Ly6/PLAUR domain-containing protein-like n=2 Tax=Xenopus laevis TaxID=8355 RepID=A0A1L8FPL7_XENLA|nr:phospholipase A2 inhibitor and Ly6/PLAUR domain-containing protein-like [Xenopus laevis]OCT73544.1 hypothetical protein XELAEV_18036523mg [Xenopus laevis]